MLRGDGAGEGARAEGADRFGESLLDVQSYDRHRWVAGSTDIACELRRCEIAPRAALRGGQTIRPERPNSSTKKPARTRLVSTTHAVPSTFTGAVIVPVHVMRNGGMGSFAQ